VVQFALGLLSALVIVAVAAGTWFITERDAAEV